MELEIVDIAFKKENKAVFEQILIQGFACWL